MSQDRDTNFALFIDFDNVALGARDARQRFDIKILMQRVLEKGKVIVKKAYADWHYYKEHMSPLHEAAIELIEIPMPRISGKNSADIKLVVDAMDLCYSKDHIDTFVIVSGDSDFSPLVSKLRENNKRVIGIGVKNSSSHLLINNCDEFMFYDDIYRNAVGKLNRSVTHVPEDKQELFDFLVTTAQSLLQESRGVLYSSLIKDTMTRKQPDFNERNFGFSNFGELLDEARRLGLLVVERDARAGGTWVVHGLGSGSSGAQEGEGGKSGSSSAPAASASSPSSPSSPSSSSSRSSRRRRSRGRGRSGEGEKVAKDSEQTQEVTATPGDQGSAGEKATPPVAGDLKSSAAPVDEMSGDGRAREARGHGPDAAGSGEKKAEAEGRKAATKKSATRKAATKKTPTKKAATKKTPTKKAPAKKSPTKKAVTKKTPTKKAATKKTPTKKAATKKVTTTKVPTKKSPTRKAVAKKSPTKKAAPRKTPKKTPADPADS